MLNCDNENLVYGPHEVSVGQARCLGGQMVESCRGLRIFLCLTLVTCLSLHFHVCFTELKIYHLSFFHNEKFCLFVSVFVCLFCLLVSFFPRLFIVCGEYVLYGCCVQRLVCSNFFVYQQMLNRVCR